MNTIKLNKQCKDQFGEKCPFWITGKNMSWDYPCKCKEDDGYCYCLYSGFEKFNGDWEKKLYLKCPFKPKKVLTRKNENRKNLSKKI
jgi:hypothetical protein